jgi:hypothetical protein
MCGKPSSGDGAMTIVEVNINCKTKNCSNDQTYNNLTKSDYYVLISTVEFSLNF